MYIVRETWAIFNVFFFVGLIVLFVVEQNDHCFLQDIQACEECQELYQKQLKLWVWRLLQYSSLLYLMASIIVYLWYLPEQMIGKVILVLPFVVFPLL